MSRHPPRRRPTLSRVSDAPAPPTPDFVTPVRTGLGEPSDGDVSEISAERLAPSEAKVLARRLQQIADARLRARAASRHKFVG
jgi:hypothetical protein